MAIKVPFTSNVDKYINILRLLTNYFLLALIVSSIIWLSEILGLFKLFNSTINIFIFIGLFIFGIYVNFNVFGKFISPIMNTLSSYIYIRKNLETKISWSEAKSVAFLFVSNETKKWYPMREVLRIPKEERVQYIMKFADKVLFEYNKPTIPIF